MNTERYIKLYKEDGAWAFTESHGSVKVGPSAFVLRFDWYSGPSGAKIAIFFENEIEALVFLRHSAMVDPFCWPGNDDIREIMNRSQSDDHKDALRLLDLMDRCIEDGSMILEDQKSFPDVYNECFGNRWGRIYSWGFLADVLGNMFSDEELAECDEHFVDDSDIPSRKFSSLIEMARSGRIDYKDEATLSDLLYLIDIVNEC